MIRLGLLLMGFLALPLCAWMLLSDPHEARTLRSPASLTESPPPQEGGFVFRPRAGTVYRYAYRRRILLKGFESEMPPIAFGGELTLQVLEAGPKGFTALVRQQMSGQPKNQVALKVMSDERGEKIRLLSRARETEEDSQQEAVVKDLLSQLFFAARSDTVGPFEARFETLPPSGGSLRFRKAKIAYLGQGPRPTIISSEHFLKWSPARAMPEEVSGREATRLGEGEASLSSESAYQLRFEGTAPAPGADESLLASLDQEQGLRLTGGPGETAPSSLNWAELVKDLRRLESLGQSERLALFGELVKLLGAKGVGTADLLDLLRSQNAVKAGAKSALFQTVVGALATEGSPASQAALRELYQDPACPTSGKGTILASFTTTQAPAQADTQKFLEDLMEGETNRDLAQGAAFALGSALEKAGDGDQAQRSIQRIIDAWKAAVREGNRSDQLALLDAMGNSGRLEFFSSLSEAVAFADQELRAKAVFSLRFLRYEPAARLIATALGDAETRVRAGAVAAMGLADWSELFRAALTNCSATEPDAQVRASCRELEAKAAGQVAQN